MVVPGTVLKGSEFVRACSLRMAVNEVVDPLKIMIRIMTCEELK
jgi:hypothetical protein